MDCCLISAATVNDARSAEELSRDQREPVPLGILSLTGVLKREGIGTEVVDLDRLFLTWLAERDGAHNARGFHESVAAKLAEAGARVYGFGSICSSYPLTLRVATALKRLRADAVIVLGGPQATAAAEETVAEFPAVDVVVCGEGDLILPALVGALTDGGDLGSIPGVVFRRAGGVVRTPAGPLLTDLDSLPMPAFGALPYVTEYGFLPLEAGRGCPFSCTFCSTSQFFRHAFRTKSVRTLIGQILDLRRRYGVTNFEFVQDNFTVNRGRVVEFCEALLASGARTTWSCSARTDCVDDALLDLMHKAGCRGIFFGVESGSERIQRVIRKGLDPAAARERIRHATRRKIEAAVALMAGFPEETREDLGKTADFFVDVLRDDYAQPQLSLLSPLTGTPVHVQHSRRLVLDDVVSDMAFQGLERDVHEMELIAAHPWVFSSYFSIPTPRLDRRYVHELRLFLLSLRSEFRWLLVALEQVSGDTLRVFSWWRARREATSRAGGASRLEAYYSGADFRMEFLAFVRDEVAEEYPDAAHVLRALVEYLESLATCECGDAPPASSREVRLTGEAMHDLPVRTGGVHVARLPVDLSRVVRRLRRRRPLAGVPRQETTVVTRVRNDRTEIVQLSPASAGLLGLCDGTRDIRAVIEAFSTSRCDVGGIPGDAASLVGLELLRRGGLIRLVRPPAAAGRAPLDPGERAV
ncbi:MAG TPA: radical SAM protein [Thermoanaerobaculaceae bacterium]|nr:radical SAM protein [Thermoanaerobaculaceae bacterium]